MRTEEARDGQTVDPSAIDPLRAVATSRLGFLARIISRFLVEAARLVTELKSAATIGDRDRIGRAAGTLRKSAASVGAFRLAALCRDLEESLRAPSAPSPLIEPIAAEHERVAEILSGIIAKGEMSHAPR